MFTDEQIAEIRRIIRQELIAIEDEQAIENEEIHKACIESITDTYGSGDE